MGYKKPGGFTLIEAILAIAIAAVVFSVFIQAVLSTNMYVRLQDFQTTATHLAQQYMEGALSQPYNDISSYNVFFDEEDDPIPNGSTFVVLSVEGIDDPDFGPDTGPGGSPPVDYKKITVTVSWEGNAPHYVGSQSYSLSCFATPSSGLVLR